MSKENSLMQVPLAELTATVAALGADGATRDHLTLIRKSATVRKAIMAALTGTGSLGRLTLTQLAKLLDNAFLGPDVWNALQPGLVKKGDLPRFRITGADLDAPCPFEAGKRVRDTHVVLIVPKKVSLDTFQDLFPPKSQPRLYRYGSDRWCVGQDFATFSFDQVTCYLLYKKAVPNSFNKSWKDQQALLPKGYIVPKPHVVTAGAMLYQKQTEEYLFSNCWVRTDAETNEIRGVNAGSLVGVGDFVTDGLFVSSCHPDRCSGNLGVAAAREYTIIES